MKREGICGHCYHACHCGQSVTTEGGPARADACPVPCLQVSEFGGRKWIDWCKCAPCRCPAAFRSSLERAMGPIVQRDGFRIEQLGSTWRTTIAGTIGFVVVRTRIGLLRCYMGNGAGNSEKVDLEWIAAFGARLSYAEALAFFPWIADHSNEWDHS